MTDRDRQRRLHVENRLEELRRKYGADLENGALPAWLDTYEGYLHCRSAADHAFSQAPIGDSPVANGRAAPAVIRSIASSAVSSRPVVTERPKADFSDLDV